MTLFAERLGSVAFVPLADARLTRVPRLTRYPFAADLGTLPIADSEVLNLSHHCAIAIRQGAGGPTVVCVLDPVLLRSAPVGRDGRWNPPYAPLALRSLPLRLRMEKGRRIVEVAPALDHPSDTDPGASDFVSLFDAAGNPTPEHAALVAQLDRLARGAARLADAAKMLMAAELLVPVGPLDQAGDPVLMVVSGERLASLPPARAAALTADACLPFDLAAASLFSQRWLAKGVIQGQWQMAETVPVLPRETMLDHGLTETMDMPFQLDDSALFSFEAFASASEGVDERT